ncbi:hypothetical protein RHMOL_Rhmol08G0216500 [Rhododendron molle]|uniref:Uncharacterized protein n=1 Tax=Rhododendron molle TaxID=49168 RepID=A0ACC0MRP1_RHOML|nr:hypothetical protein RHMOL_Rhmol08G0216500 [Rhododendron molle]
MGSEEDVAAAEVKAKNAGRRQNEKLYDAAGILNTKLMRAGKKRRKRANKSSGDAMEDDEDYDFKVDYVKKGSAMDDGEENEEAGGSNQTRFEVLASRVIMLSIFRTFAPFAHSINFLHCRLLRVREGDGGEP